MVPAFLEVVRCSGTRLMIVFGPGGSGGLTLWKGLAASGCSPLAPLQVWKSDCRLTSLFLVVYLLVISAQFCVQKAIAAVLMLSMVHLEEMEDCCLLCLRWGYGQQYGQGVVACDLELLIPPSVSVNAEYQGLILRGVSGEEEHLDPHVFWCLEDA